MVMSTEQSNLLQMIDEFQKITKEFNELYEVIISGELCGHEKEMADRRMDELRNSLEELISNTPAFSQLRDRVMIILGEDLDVFEAEKLRGEIRDNLTEYCNRTGVAPMDAFNDSVTIDTLPWNRRLS